MTRFYRPIRIALLGCAALAAPLLAQTATAPADDEIIVTAERRAASVQDVPISITALSGSTLEAAGIRGTEQLSDLTPGLLVQRSVVGKISIRGIGNENYTIAGDPGVAVHSDGVYVARAAAGLFDLFDINRVEVLRGPQGTLYGRNATGGVINVIPNAPDADRFSAHLTGEYGNYNAVRVDGHINAPLGGGWALRVAALGSWRDGFTTNTNANARSRGFGDLDSKDVWAVRGQLGYDDGGPFTARLSVEHLEDRSNLPAYKYLNRPGALPNADFGGGATAFAPGNLRTVNQGFEPAIPGFTRGVGSKRSDFFLTRQTGVALHLGYDAGGVDVASITGYRKTRFNWFNDGDGADTFYVNYIQQDRNEQWSQELQLSSKGDGPLQWLLGGFYFRETGDSFIALPFTFGAGLPFYIAIDGTAKTSALAGYGEVRWQATDRLKLTIGGRYSHENRKSTYRYEINFGAPFVRTPSLDRDFNAFTPRFVIAYEASDSTNLYASVTRGFKSGGFNLLAVQPAFEPEKVWAYEAGVKLQTADRKFTLNANGFYYDYTNQQVGQIVNLQSVLTNAASSRIWGAEAEFTARPTEGLQVGGTLAYLDTKYRKFCTGDPTQPTAPVSPGCDAANPIDLKGNRLPRAPQWVLTAFVDYTAELGDAGKVNLRGDLRHQSDMFFTQFNRPLIAQGGTVTANASLTWTSANDRFSLGGFVQNLTNETYFTEVLESGAFNPQLVGQAYVAPPRTYGVRASVKF
ncbi:TonB-dependent receptor [Sandaracinobacteroides saxicola]|uniref:TonB-dependent receptor n=1 Tax=Sandaracinobacteroides saxicola TaxID=2759707 RepID=A0A7G5II97_9SPHN|nr:TonB-dependent receptor [Sandaracinobacteroides saxicola]QMW23089.1 TonB-dependent receptor [Sandaracinobacteroides saxicola]